MTIAAPPVSSHVRPATAILRADRTPAQRRYLRRFHGSFTGMIASWYYDTGLPTASGYHAFYGVASRTMRFGQRLTLKYHGRAVRVTVDDRGPYVYDRQLDLNENVAHALGFTGVATVRVSTMRPPKEPRR